MHRPQRLKAAVLALILSVAAPAAAQRAGAPAGEFDHYLLALSWVPGWCAAEDVAPDRDARCADGSGAGWGLHGLWPQDARGWPEFCRTPARDPTRRETAAMADLMGSGGQAWYQWRKHGRCSGLDPTVYFAQARAAFAAVALPDPEALAGGDRLRPAELMAALRDANPGLPADGIAVSCRSGGLVELRLCLTRDLAPRACTPDVLERACDGPLRVEPTP
jgi:ribonuclease T2